MKNIKVNYSHDSITIVFSSAKFYIKRNGYKASGNISRSDFNNLVKYFKSDDDLTNKELIDKLINNESLISSVYPNWNI